MLRFSPPRSFYAHSAKSVSNIVDTLSMFLYSVMLPQCLLHLLLHDPHWLRVVIGALLGSGPSAAELCVLPVTERVLYITGWNFGLLQNELWKCLISGIMLLKYKHLKSPNTFSFSCNIKTRRPCQRTRCIPKKGFWKERAHITDCASSPVGPQFVSGTSAIFAYQPGSPARSGHPRPKRFLWICPCSAGFSRQLRGVGTPQDTPTGKRTIMLHYGWNDVLLAFYPICISYFHSFFFRLLEPVDQPEY